MGQTFEIVWETLCKYNQQHLLNFFEELSDVGQSRLLDQLTKIDFEKVQTLYNLAQKSDKPTIDPSEIAPLHATDWNTLSCLEKEKLADIGMALLRQGKVGALVVAGGQGSRLGHNGPKGTLDIGLPSHKSLFQLQAERLLNLTRRSDRAIPWYIMTSPDNHADTVQSFVDNGYFGYSPQDICFFQQDTFPPVDETGRLLLSSKDSVSLAPGGNGDCFAAMARSGALDDMKSRGIEWLFHYNVDNALIRIADPSFVGFAATTGAPIASKVVNRDSPKEKVGMLCQWRGRPCVIEYSDLSPELLDLLANNPAYAHANVSIHLFRTDFIERMSQIELPFHVAHKRISYLNESGQWISPDAPNAYKFEKFFFDSFPYGDSMAVLRVSRAEEFAPIKNKDGKDSPATARQLVLQLHHKWLVEAGIPGDIINGQDIEISPLTSYAGEGLAGRQLLDAIQAGQKLI